MSVQLAGVITSLLIAGAGFCIFRGFSRTKIAITRAGVLALVSAAIVMCVWGQALEYSLAQWAAVFTLFACGSVCGCLGGSQPGRRSKKRH